MIAICDRPALQGIHKLGVINDARKNAMGDFVISLERVCTRVVQSNQSGGTRLVNTVEMSGKVTHTAHVQRIMLQQQAPTSGDQLPGWTFARLSDVTKRAHSADP